MEQPSWLTEACPAWCERDHEEGDHPDDRRHQGRGIEVPIVVASGAIPGPEGASLVLVVRLDRPVGGSQTWMRVEASEAAEPRLALRSCDAVELAHVILRAASP